MSTGQRVGLDAMPPENVWIPCLLAALSLRRLQHVILLVENIFTPGALLVHDTSPNLFSVSSPRCCCGYGTGIAKWNWRLGSLKRHKGASQAGCKSHHECGRERVVMADKSSKLVLRFAVAESAWGSFHHSCQCWTPCSRKGLMVV